mgnify:CR=1 FL=1
MKFYLIDDDKNVLHILKRIIRDRGLGEIAGTAETVWMHSRIFLL